jgi:cyclohexyl-isocyanide hydratase
LKVAIFVFPGVEELDFVGFLEALAVANRASGGKPFETQIVAATKEPVVTNGGMKVVPDADLEGMAEPDLFFAPGGGAGRGTGVDTVAQDPAVKETIGRLHGGGKMVWSVCTGAFILEAAGVLKGRRAATHHAYRETLAAMGVQVVSDRTVTDGTVTTGGGISSSIDVGLELVRKTLGEETAKKVGESMEYPPASS